MDIDKEIENEIYAKAGVSNRAWSEVDKSQLPASCFLVVGDPKLKATWKLPIYEGAGEIDPDTGMHKERGLLNLNALRAASAAVGGAHTGEAMHIPAEARAKLESLLKEYKIGEAAKHAKQIPEAVKLGHDDKQAAAATLTDKDKLDVVDLDGQEVFSTGRWTPQNGKPVDYFVNDLQELAKAGNSIAETYSIAIKDPELEKIFKDGAPALGWLRNFRVVGEKLITDLKSVPRKIAQLIQAGAYRKKSLEIVPNYKDEVSHTTYKRAPVGLALLGAEQPAVGSINDLFKLYEKCAFPGAQIFTKVADGQIQDFNKGGDTMTPEEIQKLQDECKAAKEESAKLKEKLAKADDKAAEQDKKIEEGKAKHAKAETDLALLDKMQAELETLKTENVEFKKINEQSATKEREQFYAKLAEKFSPQERAALMANEIDIAKHPEVVKFKKADGTELTGVDAYRADIEKRAEALSKHALLQKFGKENEDSANLDRDDEKAQIEKIATEEKLDAKLTKDYEKAVAIFHYRKRRGEI